MNNVEKNINNIRKGTYAHAKWQNVQVINGVEFIKVSKGVVRVLSSVLVSKKGIKFVRFFLTHNHNLKTICQYFMDGVSISKEMYENFVETPKNNVLDVCFAKHLDDVLELSNKGIK